MGDGGGIRFKTPLEKTHCVFVAYRRDWLWSGEKSGSLILSCSASEEARLCGNLDCGRKSSVKMLKLSVWRGGLWCGLNIHLLVALALEWGLRSEWWISRHTTCQTSAVPPFQLKQRIFQKPGITLLICLFHKNLDLLLKMLASDQWSGQQE